MIDGMSATTTWPSAVCGRWSSARKISGRTRSDAGTRTRLALASLFATWQARRRNPFAECLTLLQQTPYPQL